MTHRPQHSRSPLRTREGGGERCSSKVLLSWSDPGFDQARRHVRGSASSHTKLPKVESDQNVPDLSPLVLPSPAECADRLVRILAGRASTRAGLPWRDWSELAQRVLAVDEHRLGHVTRAWNEAGLVDVASYARWWHRIVVARRPRLVAFRIGDNVGAVLMGLVLPTTRDEFRRVASRKNALVEERLSVSNLVPRSLAFRLQNAGHLDDLADACRVDVSWLDIESASFEGTSRHDCMSEPPSHYEWLRRWPRWSLVPGEHPGVEVEHHMRRDRPEFWVVSRGTKRAWTYDLNVARAWAAVLIQAPPLNVVGAAYLEANHAYVPLPLARALSVIGAGLPGPTADGSYRYPVGSPRVRERVLDVVTRTFDPSRLAAAAARQATG